MGDRVEVARLPLCDICRLHDVIVEAKYDGKTKSGPWANMCEKHFRTLGVGLGTGRGQKLVLSKGEKR